MYTHCEISKFETCFRLKIELFYKIIIYVLQKYSKTAHSHVTNIRNYACIRELQNYLTYLCAGVYY